MGGWLVDKLIDGVLDWFAMTILGALNALWDLLSATVFVSPDVTQLPQVTAFAGTSRGVVNACYVLAFLWMAILVLGRDTIQAKYGPGELIPRLIIGLIASNFAIPLCSTLIGLANAVTAAFTSQDINSPESLRHLRDTTAAELADQTGHSPASFLLLTIGLLIAVLVGVLVVQWIIRLGVLVVAVGISPIALALHGTPQTEGAAKLWWRVLLAALGTVVMQAVALHTTLTIFLDPDTNLTVLGLPAEPGAVMNLFIVVCMLWGVIKIPGLMRRYVTQGRPNAMGMIMRVVLVQQISRGLSRAFNSKRRTLQIVGGGRGAGGAGAGAASRSWPVTSGGGGRGSSAAARSAASSTPRSGGAAPRPLPRPTSTAPGRVGVAYPSGGPVRPYTREELAEGVDVYTRAMKARAAAATSREATP